MNIKTNNEYMTYLPFSFISWKGISTNLCRMNHFYTKLQLVITNFWLLRESLNMCSFLQYISLFKKIFMETSASCILSWLYEQSE